MSGPVREYDFGPVGGEHGDAVAASQAFGRKQLGHLADPVFHLAIGVSPPFADQRRGVRSPAQRAELQFGDGQTQRLAGLPLALIPRLSVIVASCSSIIGAISFQLIDFNDELALVRPPFEAPIGRFELTLRRKRYAKIYGPCIMTKTCPAGPAYGT